MNNMLHNGSAVVKTKRHSKPLATPDNNNHMPTPPMLSQADEDAYWVAAAKEARAEGMAAEDEVNALIRRFYGSRAADAKACYDRSRGKVH
jgi:hypothetical protein